MSDNDMYVFGPRVELSKNSLSLGEYFVKRLEQHGEKIAQIIEIDGEEHTLRFSDILRRGKIVAAMLRQHGVQAGDTVMSVTGNTLEYAPIMWGTLFAGAAVAPCNPLYDQSDMTHLLTTIKPRVVVTNRHAEACLQAALTAYGDPSVALITVADMYRYMRENDQVDDFYLGKVEDPDTHVATVLCTTGTSGKPKCVEITHTAIFRQADLDKSASNGDGSANPPVAVNIAGPFGIAGQYINIFFLNLGCKCVLVPIETFSETEFLRTLEKYKITHAVLSPCQLIALAKCAEGVNYDLSSLTSVLIGGSPVSLAMFDLAKTKLKLKITAAYAMTEALKICSSWGPDNELGNCSDKMGTVGKLLTNVVGKIVDVETGKALGPNKEGEFCMKSPYLFLRYRNNPAATAAAFDADGFFHTGDVAYYDDDECFFLVDRIKELIKYRNVHVPASDIEEVLLLHPAVLEAAVIGVYNEEDWEHATGIVVKRPGETLSEEELVTLVESKLPRFKWLHGGVRIVQSIPKSLNGKIQKRELRAAYSAMPPDLPTLHNRSINMSK